MALVQRCWLLLLLVVLLLRSTEQAYLKGGGDCPDPFLTWDKGSYYLLCTTGGDVTIRRKCNDMDFSSGAQSRTVFRGNGFTDFWAPELANINGVWYIYFAAVQHDDPKYIATQYNWVLRRVGGDTSDAWGDYEFVGRMGAPPDENAWAIDPHVMRIPSGPYSGYYFLWGGMFGGIPNDYGRIWLARMISPSQLGTRVMLTEPTEGWEKKGTSAENGGPGGAVEGPASISAPDGSVHITYSASGCWTPDYSLGLLSLPPGANPLDPGNWEKSGPVFRTSVSGNVYGPGHNSLLYTPWNNEYLIAYHAKNSLAGGCGGGRSGRYQTFTWKQGPGYLVPDFGTPDAS